MALDVGYGQLDCSLRDDPRVVVIERDERPRARPAAARRRALVICDVSFISLRIGCRRRCASLRPARRSSLVKPQFEAGRGEVRKGGVVRDPRVHARVVREVAAAAPTGEHGPAS